jgi:hypothetical protein
VKRPASASSSPARRRGRGRSRRRETRPWPDIGIEDLVGISLWTTRAALEASVATARTALDGAARLGATIVGQPQTFAEAFDATPAR